MTIRGLRILSSASSQGAQDFQAIGRIVKGTYRRAEDEFPSPTYGLIDTAAMVEGDMRSAKEIVAVDTETSLNGDVWSIQYSVAGGMGRFIYASNEDAVGALGRAIKKHQLTAVMHNALFDAPKLEDIGVKFNSMRDTMVMAYLLGDLSQGLGVFPTMVEHLVEIEDRL